MSDQVFDQDYVTKLREENAKWRNKYRELEAQQHNQDIKVELAKRGIHADPSWVSIEEGQTVGDAVDALVASYPSLNSNGPNRFPGEGPLDFLTEPEPKPRVTPKAVAPSTQQSTNPKPVRAARITQRNIAEIRKDPKARAKVRDFYRDLLKNNSNQGE